MSHQQKKKKMAMHRYQKHPSLSEFHLRGRKTQTVVCDIHRCLVRSPSFFPYFMLVTFEGGGILRAMLLLLLSPLLLILDDEMEMRVMIFITFFGMRVRDVERVSRTVLPKFYLENLNLRAYEALDSAGTKAVLTVVPRVMVEAFLKDYLAVDSVVGTELRTLGEYFTGLVSPSGLLVKHRALEDLFGGERPDVGIGSSNIRDHLFVSLCKVYRLILLFLSDKSTITHNSN